MGAFRQQLRQFFAKAFNGFYIDVTTPKVFLQKCEVPNIPIVITPANLHLKVEKHGLTKDELLDFNTLLNSPLMVFHSEKDGRFDKAVCVITNKKRINTENDKTRDEFLCAIIYLDETINKKPVNNISSIHYRNINSLIKWAEDGYLIDSDIEKIKKIPSDSLHDASKFEYLLSLLEKAKVNKNTENAKKNKNKSSIGNAADEPIISREEMLKKTADEIAEIANRNSSGYSEYSNWRTNKRTALAIYDDYKKGKLSFDNGYFVPSVQVEPKFKVGDRVKSLTYKDAFGNNIATITKVHLLKFGTVVRYDLHFDDYGNVRGFYEQDLMLLEDEPQPTAQPDDEEEMLEIEAEALQLAIKLKLALLDNTEPQADSQYPQRNGNVTANDLKATFGFRYVNVDINLDEKQEQQMLNVSYDTFRLLAQIIGKPPIAIGLGRNLTLNIGIKRMGFTTGGCYSPQYKALNFKSLEDYKHIAHEWLHALDHYLYYTYGKTITENPNMMQSDRIHWRPTARVEIRDAWGEVHAHIQRSDYHKHSEQVAKVDSNGNYWIDRAELLARAFEVWTDAKMRAIGEHNNHLVSMFPNNPYPDFSNPKDAPISAAFDALFAAFRMEKYPYDIESLR